MKTENHNKLSAQRACKTQTLATCNIPREIVSRLASSCRLCQATTVQRQEVIKHFVGKLCYAQQSQVSTPLCFVLSITKQRSYYGREGTGKISATENGCCLHLPFQNFKLGPTACKYIQNYEWRDITEILYYISYLTDMDFSIKLCIISPAT